MVPLFKANKIFFPQEYKENPVIIEALDELTLASPAGFKSKHDDFIDTISMLSSLMPWKPTQHGNLKNSSDGDIWDVDIDTQDENRITSYIV
jgi:hypothetical protein